MRWFRRRRDPWPRPRRIDMEEAPEVGGERWVFWKTKEQYRGVDFGPVGIVNANDPDEVLEDPRLWLTWEEAQEFARRRGLEIEDV